MKTRLFILVAALLGSVSLLRAQTATETLSDSAFLAQTHRLFAEANECYASTGNKLEIYRLATAYQQAVEKRRAEGQLSAERVDSLMQEVNKLWGDYHYLNGEEDASSYAKAEQLFRGCVDFAKQHTAYHTTYHDLFILYQELGQLYYRLGRYEDALQEMNRSFEEVSKYVSPEDGMDDYLDIMSQLAICKARVGQYDAALELIGEVLENYVDTDGERYGEALRKKAKILMLQEESGGSHSDEALQCYKKYFELKRDDALNRFEGMSTSEREQYWMRIRPFVIDCYRLENADPAFLYDVTLMSKGLLLQLNRDGGGTQSLRVSWQQIQQVLPQDGCAIEFVQYEKCGQQRMGALVLTKSAQPRFVALTMPDSVLSHAVYGSTVKERLEVLDNGKTKDDVYLDSLDLFHKIWTSDLLAAVGQSAQVFFAPDGYLHQMAIEYMLPREASQLRMHRLTTTRRLLQMGHRAQADRALLIGGVDFRAQTVGSVEGNDSTAYDCAHRKGGYFAPLPSSEPEIDSVLVHRGRQQADMRLVGSEATEQAFRQNCGRYSVVHITSHGVFNGPNIPQGTDLKPCMTDASLSENYIALAGAQTAVGSQTYDARYQDGLLSAREMSSLDMTGVDLIVLACCQTGLGYVTADGIYGIQRGLKNAGAGAMVVTLWEVNDKATQLFMAAFHDKMAHGMPIAEAFRQTRRLFMTREVGDDTVFVDPEESARYGIDDYFCQPRFRDAFVLIDALE